MELINILFIASFFLNFYLVAKLTAQDNFITEQQLKIRKLEVTIKNWQKTHSKCIDYVCMERVLDDITGDM